MNIDITGRKLDVTPAIRKLTEERIKKLSRFLPNIDEVNLTLDVQKHRQIAELIIHSEQNLYTSFVETDDMYAAITKAFDKIKKQARRRRKKIRDLHRKDKSRLHDMVMKRNFQVTSTGAKIIPTEGFSLKPMDVEEASMQLGTSDNIFLVFRNAENEKINIIHKKKDGNFGLIEPE